MNKSKIHRHNTHYDAEGNRVWTRNPPPMITGVALYNKLIARFMGLNPCDDRDEYHSTLYTNVTDDLSYHKSWDWLMPVVEKISDIKSWSLNATFEWLSESQDRDGLYNKNDTYRAVVEFIKLYNEEPK